MGAKSEMLAKQFEAKSRDALLTLERLSEADWQKVTASEQWSVGVTAHHIAGVFHVLPDVVRAMAAGRSLKDFNMDHIDEMNAQHARDHANCTRADTIKLYREGAAAAAAAIRALSDEGLAKSGTVMSSMPPMTVEQIIVGGLLQHVDEHFGSIRQAVG